MDIRAVRKQLNITQDKFAQLLGVARVTVNRWENGRTKPSRLVQHGINELVNGELRKMKNQ